MNKFQEHLTKANNNDYASTCYLIENAAEYYDEIVKALDTSSKRLPSGLKV